MSLFSTLQTAPPSVRRLTLVNFLEQSGNQAAYFVGLIGTATYVLGADAFHISILVAILNVSYVFGSGFVGVLVDRYGPHTVLVRLHAVYALVALAALMLPISYTLLVVWASLMALLSGSIATTVSAFPPYLVQDADELKVANSLIDTAIHTGFIAGPAAGGLITSLLPSQAVFGFTAVAMALAALVALRVHERYGAPQKTADNGPSSGSPLSEFAAGVRLTFSSKPLRFLFIVGFMGFFAYGAYDSLESIFYRDVLRVGVSWMGWLSMMSGVGSVVGSAILLRIPTERVNTRLLVATLLITGVGSMLYVGTNLLPVAAVGQTLTGMGFGLMMPVQHLLVQQSTDIAYLGRVSGVMRIGLNSSGVLPLIVAPFLAELFGVQAVLFGASAFVAAVAVFFALRLRVRSQAVA